MYTYDDVITYIEEEDVKFIKFAFCDVNGVQKNISVLADNFKRAVKNGVPFDASAIFGFKKSDKSDLYLFPDYSTLAVLPWRPSHGRVIRFYCDIKYADGTPYERDSRRILKEAEEKAGEMGIKCRFGSELEFYLFKAGENGENTFEPFDLAGYFDIAPDDKGENVRREICFTLEEMGIHPETSHHEEGPGQNEIDFMYNTPLAAADDAITYKNVVKTVSQRYGLCADFSAKPIADKAGNGFHINISVKSADGRDCIDSFAAGILRHIKDMTLFLNPTEDSYKRLGNDRAPRYIAWNRRDRSQLIRIPAEDGEHRRIELCSPDPMTNPYIAYALIIYAGLDGIKNRLELPGCFEKESLEKYGMLPKTYEEAKCISENSDFIKEVLPEGFAGF